MIGGPSSTSFFCNLKSTHREIAMWIAAGDFYFLLLLSEYRFSYMTKSPMCSGNNMPCMLMFSFMWFTCQALLPFGNNMFLSRAPRLTNDHLVSCFWFEQCNVIPTLWALPSWALLSRGRSIQQQRLLNLCYLYVDYVRLSLNWSQESKCLCKKNSVANAYCIVHWMVREGKDDDIFLLIQKVWNDRCQSSCYRLISALCSEICFEVLPEWCLNALYCTYRNWMSVWC
jgi:hypothetical protein